MSDQNTIALDPDTKHYVLVEYAGDDLDGDDPKITIGGNPNAAMLKNTIQAAADELAKLYCSSLSGYNRDAVVDWASEHTTPNVQALHESLLRGIVDDHLRNI